MLSNLAFLVFEYKNYISSLIFAYDYVYSKRYEKEHEVYLEVLMQNYIELAKQGLKLVEGELYKSYITDLSLWKVLDYRLRVHQLRYIIKDMIVDKIDVYSCLYQKLVNYELLVTASTALNKRLADTSQELKTLLKLGPKNIKLCREAIMYELCVLEKRYISSKLRKHYNDALVDVHNRVGSIKSLFSRINRFNLFNSSNIVVFTRNEASSFVIYKFTPNAAELFGVRKQFLQGKPLTDFMPGPIALTHDRMILRYLNGMSNSKKGGRILAAIKSRSGQTRSVMILPKLEYFLSDDIYVGALISIRKKNSYPLLYTDARGTIIGYNRLALKLINQGEAINQGSLFAMFPRLFGIYFPKKASTTNEPAVTTSDAGPVGGTEEFDNESSEKDQTTIGPNSILKASAFHASTRVVELFQFQMFGQTNTEVQEDLINTENSPNLNYSAQKPLDSHGGASWNRFKSAWTTRGMMSANFQNMFKMVSDNRKLLLDNLTKIVRVRASIETMHYQRHLVVKEIALQSVQRTSHRVQQFFKLFAKDQGSLLVDALLLSPESLNAIYKLSGYQAHLNMINNKLKSPPTLNTNSEMSKKRMNKQLSMLKQEILNVKDRMGVQSFKELSKVVPTLSDKFIKDSQAFEPTLTLTMTQHDADKRFNTENFRTANSIFVDNAAEPFKDSGSEIKAPLAITRDDVSVYSEDVSKAQSTRNINLKDQAASNISGRNLKTNGLVVKTSSTSRNLSHKQQTRAKVNWLEENVQYLKGQVAKDFDNDKLTKIVDIVMSDFADKKIGDLKTGEFRTIGSFYDPTNTAQLNSRSGIHEQVPQNDSTVSGRQHD